MVTEGKTLEDRSTIYHALTNAYSLVVAALIAVEFVRMGYEMGYRDAEEIAK